MEQSNTVLVVGGGIVGLAVALGLCRQNCSVIVLEKGQFEWPGSGLLTSRVSALNGKTVASLKALGVWSTIDAIAQAPFRRMRVWDDLGGGEIAFDGASVGAAQLGFIVNNESVVQALYRVLQQEPRCRLVAGVTAKQLHQNDEGVTLETSQGEFKGRILIGADGARSWVRDQLPLAVTTRPYPHHAMTAVVRIEKAHHYTAYQNFLPTGPLGVLPLSDKNRVAIVWSCSQSLVKVLKESTKRGLNRHLTNALQCRLGHMELETEPFYRQLVEKYLETYYHRRCVVIGDAAHAIHPLAGQGANLGLADASVLASLLQPSLVSRFDERVFRRYQRHRALEHRFMRTLMRGFVEGFESQSPMVVAVRSEVFNTFNQLSLFKRWIMQGMHSSLIE